MKLYILPLGFCDVDKEKVFTPGKDQGVRIDIPMWAALVRTEGLNVLIDTGMHPIHIEDPGATFAGTPVADWIRPVMRGEDTIVNRLRELNLTPEDIDVVVNTHLHSDHAGGNCFFTHSTILVQKDHYQHALAMPGDFPPRYFLLPRLTYDLIEGDMTLLPGLDIIRCPGHAPGMQAVVVSLEQSGTLVLAGDAICLRENLTEDRWESYWNPTLARSSARRLRAIANAREGELFFGHDPEWWKGVRLSPEYYA